MAETRTETQALTASSQGTRATLIVCCAALCAVILRNSWVSDDAFFTFRTLDNFFSGHGLTWNVLERVQVFTHPLWLLLIALPTYLTGEFPYTTLLVGCVVSCTVFILLARCAGWSIPSMLLIALVMILSKAYIDYSTSGLENPLSHALVVIFFAAFTARGIGSTEKNILLTALLCWTLLCRIDLLVLVGPALAFAVLRKPKISTILPALLGVTPLVVWEAFSLTYYGFLVPNTAYAKLNTGIPRLELVEQGLVYLADSLARDPLTLVVVAVGIILPLARRNWKMASWSLGILLYLGYVVGIGGDFMSGRFLTAPLVASLCVVVRLSPWQAKTTWVPAILVVALGLFNPVSPLKPVVGSRYKNGDIADEKTFYYSHTSLMKVNKKGGRPRDHGFARSAFSTRDKIRAREDRSELYVDVRGAAGMFAFYAGPEVHIVDIYALGDPLLARLPARHVRTWRIGHFTRNIPQGYADTLSTGHNEIEDDDVSKYYELLTSVTRGPLFDPARLVTIFKLNIGLYDDLIDEDKHRVPVPKTIPISRVSSRLKDGTRWKARKVKRFECNGLKIDLAKMHHSSTLDISLDANDDYALQFWRAGAILFEIELLAARVKNTGLTSSTVTIPQDVSTEGFDALVILPLRGDEKYSLGHVLLR